MNWYKVCSCGDVRVKTPSKTPEEAWARFYNNALRSGYGEQNLGTARASTSAVCVEFTSLKEARDTDISDWPRHGKQASVQA